MLSLYGMLECQLQLRTFSDSEWQIRVFLYGDVGVSMDAVSNKNPKLIRQCVSLQVDLYVYMHERQLVSALLIFHKPFTPC